MAFSWSLPTGFETPITYFYVTYFLVLLMHRQYRDDENCEKKCVLDCISTRLSANICPQIWRGLAHVQEACALPHLPLHLLISVLRVVSQNPICRMCIYSRCDALMILTTYPNISSTSLEASELPGHKTRIPSF